MPAGPCLGCGLSLDGDGNLQITGVTNRDWPYSAAGHTNPGNWYCDTGTDGVKRLWMQPWNLPWGVIARTKSVTSATGYANGLGTSGRTVITPTFLTDRRYLFTANVTAQSENVTLWPTSPSGFFGAVLYDESTSTALLINQQPSLSNGYTNEFTMSLYYEHAGPNLTRTYSVRSFCNGFINSRLPVSDQAFFMVQDVGPRA
jgi:hypothetical protein